MTDNLQEDDGTDVVPIPMDRETRERLVKLSRKLGDPPARVAALLLRDILIDDEATNSLGTETQH